MPAGLPDLSLLCRLDVTEYVTALRDIISRYLPDEDWTILDTIYAYKPKSDVRDWRPPFKGKGLSLCQLTCFLLFEGCIFYKGVQLCMHTVMNLSKIMLALFHIEQVLAKSLNIYICDDILLLAHVVLATLMGSQHYMTSDRNFFEFAGDSCSYLLARDFISKTFCDRTIGFIFYFFYCLCNARFLSYKLVCSCYPNLMQLITSPTTI